MVEKLSHLEQGFIFLFFLRWLGISLLVGFFTGSASAFFLWGLDFVTSYRESHTWLIFLLPLAGFLIGLVYYLYGQNVQSGNNLLIEEVQSPKNVIPFRMAPFVLFGTFVTHLFGGSAGREGTAVQAGGALADQFSKVLRLSHEDRKILISCGISAGFASVFGTPIAGAVFGLEVFALGKMTYYAILPCFLAAIFADFFCLTWGITHFTYSNLISYVPPMSLELVFFSLLAGSFFGIVGLVFAKLTNSTNSLFQSWIGFPPLRPFVGGIFILTFFWATGSTRYLGLGLPVIAESFISSIPHWDFVVKILLTSVTLGSGFKGGEVTPLFFIGSTLGASLSDWLPLPQALLAAMGFVAVFASAANTPIACILMGLELFGTGSATFIGIACITAYIFSGHTGIYHSQLIHSPKYPDFANLKGKRIREKNQKSS